jgi:two-component system LytT family response regulator
LRVEATGQAMIRVFPIEIVLNVVFTRPEQLHRLFDFACQLPGFRRALSRAKERIAETSKEDLAERIVAALEQIRRQDEYLERLPVAENGRILFVKTREIDWIEANGNYARLHVGARAHEIRETLNNLDRKLDPRDFLRIHRSTIVNVHLIKEIQPWFHGYHLVLLQNGQELRMSRYQDEIAKRLGLA